ncbi:MAG TPA: NBR1-Ig-like domain-containing protein [Anaerolineales bacterium]|jgi:hypothetical protein|nr:NBR1-Ig-like domain-containing protein [Anaerolineales bacterium]
MKLTTNKLIIIFGTLALCVLALIPISVFAMPLLQKDTAQPDPQATVDAMVTQTVIALTLNAPTQTPLPPTTTPVPVTVTPSPTPTTPPTSAPVTYCDWMSFVKDVTIADGTVLDPGETFTKIWRIKNRGTCTWTPDYMLVFSGGEQMGGTTAVRLPGYVAPGQTVDVAVTMTAPSAAGSYRGYWMLRNTSGTLFGSGDKANIPVYVDIKVKKRDVPTHGTVGGNLCYPSEFNPPMTLYFENAHTGERFQFAIAERQYIYEVLLPAGRYYAYAWAPGYNLEGAYTHENGLMKSFFVEGGLTTPFINLCDWSPYPHAKGE